MKIVRPITFADLPALEQLAVVAGGSMSTLPANRDHLSEMISATSRALRNEGSAADSSNAQPDGATYHFVLEDTGSGEILGVSGINSAVGLQSPFYSYRIEQVVHASSELQIHNRIPALHLCQDHTGSTSLCSLFLAPQHRNDENRQLLSRARMLFIAAHRQRFADTTLVELQGVQDDDGNSPFWEALGRHFFSMEFSRANYLTGIQSKGFIADLMPHYPVYVPILPPQAQQAIGQARPDIEPIVELLKSEGFEHRGYVDIFDAGPTLEARTDQIRSLRDSHTGQLDAVAGIGNAEAPLQLIAHGELAEFRCLLASLNSQQPTIEPQAAELLSVSAGSTVRICPL